MNQHYELIILRQLLTIWFVKLNLLPVVTLTAYCIFNAAAFPPTGNPWMSWLNFVNEKMTCKRQCVHSPFGIFSSLLYQVNGVPATHSSEVLNSFPYRHQFLQKQMSFFLLLPHSVLSSSYLQQEVRRVGFLCTLTTKEEYISPV